MLVRSFNPRLNTILFLVIILLFYYNAVELFKTSSSNQLVVPHKAAHISVLSILSKFPTQASPSKNCKKLWNEIRQLKIPEYNDTNFDPENFDPFFKKLINWEVQNNTALIRSYNHCFLDQDICDVELEKDLYPWFTFESPTINSGPKTKNRKLFKKLKCFKDIKKNLKGKGIVLTATEFHFKGLVTLFTLLRALGNPLPIQIVHKGDLSDFVQDNLIKVATVPFDEKLKFKIGANSKAKLPKLKVEFINVSGVIVPKYDYRFKRFQNKLLAYLFNSFKEVIIMDVDSVPFIPLQDFFNIEEYKRTGAFFFKDRLMHHGHSMPDTLDFFKELLPTAVEEDKLNISRATKHTLENNFFNGFSHMMESGLVIVDRSKHFSNSLMAISLAQWTRAIMSRIWGDKELFWLSMSISGDENYSFNENGAASVGQISPIPNSHYPQQLELKELCSNHPGHVYKDNSLLWMNSGFKYCKKVMHVDEFNPFFKGWKLEDSNAFNDSPLKIRHALVPPVPNLPGKPFYPESDKPKYPWEGKPYCEGYTVCGYDKVGNDVGNVISFSQKETQQFDFLGKVYSKGMDVLIEVAGSDPKFDM